MKGKTVKNKVKKILLAGTMFFTMALSISITSAESEPVKNENSCKITLLGWISNCTTASIKITDPETGEATVHTVENVPIVSKVNLLSLSNEAEVNVNVQFDENWNPIITPRTSQESVLNDGITMTAGMEYSISGSGANAKVSMKWVFGTYQNKGYYYHDSPSKVWYANSEGNYYNHKQPTGHSFNYTTNTTGIYYWACPFCPYVESETRVRISGMGGSRLLTVTFRL